MSFKSWLARIFYGQEDNTINVSTYEAAEQEFFVNAYAIFTVVDFVSSLMSKIEFQTFYNGEMVRGLEWHRLNVRPNVNQSGPMFWREFWHKLLYYQEVLVVEVGDQLLIADEFTHHPEYALREDYFEQVSRGSLTFYQTFPASEVFYLSYSNADVVALIHSVLALYSRLIGQAEKQHREKSGEKGILSISTAANGPEDFEKRYGKWINDHFKSYFNGRNTVLPLYRGMAYTKTSSNQNSTSNDVSDITSLVDGALARASNAYKVPPAVLRGEVAGMSDAFDVLLTTCVDPLANLAAKEFTAKEFTREAAIKGCRVAAFTNNIKHTDVFDVATNFDKLFADGFSFNDLMRLLEMPIINEPWANAHHITKNYADVSSLEGGEPHE